MSPRRRRPTIRQIRAQTSVEQAQNQNQTNSTLRETIMDQVYMIIEVHPPKMGLNQHSPSAAAPGVQPQPDWLRSGQTLVG